MALDATARRIEPAGFTKVPVLGVEEQRGNVILDFADPGEACARLLNMLARRSKHALQRDTPAGGLNRPKPVTKP